MNTQPGSGDRGPALPYVQRVKGQSASVILLFAAYDLGLAVLIIAAGSQGIFRFAPPLLLWLMIYLMIGLKLATNLRTLVSVLRENIAILAFPAVAFISATWSLSPSHTVYSAVQLSVTYLAGIWIGWRYRPMEIALVMVLALSPLIVLSLINWATGMFGEAFSYHGGLLGIFANKNTLGRMSLLLGIAALGLIFNSRRKLVRDLVFLTVFAMAVLALALSKSATSMIFLVGTSALFVLLTMHSYRVGMRLALSVGCIMAVLFGGGLVALGNFDLANEVLGLFGKSSTLTGRTYLWEVANQQISENPWLGVGFDAYWDSGNFLALDQIQQRYGTGLISFHNFILDIRVGMGVPGLVAIFVTVGTIALTYLRYYLVSQNVEAAMMLTLFTAAIGVAMFNPLLHGQHGNMIVILIAFAVSARIETRRHIV
ncbi:MAG: O-antigen ligase family protein [Paracoccaceae bacterium]